MTKATGPRKVTFSCDGRKITTDEGRSIAAALHQHGRLALSRSTKYHRPRGWACGTGDCANCVMRVDDVPNVRTCMEPVRQGTKVRSQNSWPNARFDIFRANDLVFRKGIDHHHGFVRPRILYPLFGRVIRNFAGWGRIPKHTPPDPEKETRFVDIAVIGAGPAGLSAATAAAEAGAQVLLVDKAREPGGMLALLGRSIDPEERGKTEPGRIIAQRWAQAARETGRVIFCTQAAATGLYPGHVHVIRAPGKVLLVRSRATVLTTGALQNEPSFEGNDLPGVMSATGALALLNREGVRPGKRAVILGAGAHGLAAALELHDAGVSVEAILEPAENAPAPKVLLEEAEKARIPLWTNATLKKAAGWARVRRVHVQTPDGPRSMKVDLVVAALGGKTLPHALQGLGARLTHDPLRGGTVPLLDEDLMSSVDGLFAAGDTTGIGTIATARASGRLAGMAAARHAGHKHDEWDQDRVGLIQRLREAGYQLEQAANTTSSDRWVAQGTQEVLQ
jgi:sarcosine oxidase, subunit alpha